MNFARVRKDGEKSYYIIKYPVKNGFNTLIEKIKSKLNIDKFTLFCTLKDKRIDGKVQILDDEDLEQVEKDQELIVFFPQPENDKLKESSRINIQKINDNSPGKKKLIDPFPI